MYGVGFGLGGFGLRFPIRGVGFEASTCASEVEGSAERHKLAVAVSDERKSGNCYVASSHAQ